MSNEDNVNHPKHYTSHASGVECIEITEHYNFCVGNAIKYSSNGGDVTVKCEVEENWIRIDVNDQGDGIPIEEQERVFDKFFRGQKAVQSTEPGNGLGLAFSREIARLHDGDILLQSIPGQGSTFTLRLPIGGQSRSGV